MIKPSDRVIFIDEEVKKTFENLLGNDPLKKGIEEAIKKIKGDCQAGEHISPKSPLIFLIASSIPF